MKTLRLIVLSLSFAVLSCAHEPPAAAPSVGLESLTPGLTGLLLPLTLSPENGAVLTECKLTVKSEGGHTIDTLVRVGFQVNFANAPEGTYALAELNCGPQKDWDFTDKKWPSLYVVHGKLSLAAPMDFRVTDKGTLTTFFSNRAVVNNVVNETYFKLRAETRAGVISGYTKAAITAKMAKHTEYQITVRLPADQGPDQKTEEISYPDYKDCYTTELAVNPLYVGSVDMEISFKAKKFLKSTIKENSSLYSSKFMECVDDISRKFSPNRNIDLRYDVTL